MVEHKPQVNFPLSTREQLTQIGEQLNYLEGNISATETMEELDAYGLLEKQLIDRMFELTQEHQSPANIAVRSEGQIVDVRATEVFGDSVAEISGVKSMRFIGRDTAEASRIKDTELGKLAAYSSSDKKSDTAVDAFEFITEDDARFRLVDASPLLSANGRQPFTSGDKHKFKQDALTDLTQALTLYAESGYTAPLSSVRVNPSLKYISRGDRRIYFTVVNSEISDAAQQDGAQVPERTFAYVASCQKNMEEPMYQTVLGIHMKI